MSSIGGLALAEELAEVAQRVRASVVQVRAGRGGIGSGVIWRTSQPEAAGAEAEATVITNAHVVRAARQETFTLRLADGRELTGTVTAVDPEHDLAALRVRGAGLRPADIGDSSALRVGELVLAVGNPWGIEGAVTAGVVAAHAPVDPDVAVEPAEEDTPDDAQRGGPGRWSLRGVDLIQADIQLYPGNSGGPLADARGRVVGINAMVGGGLAFAIPSRTVQHFLEDAEQITQRLYLGVRVFTVPLPAALRQRLSIAQGSAVLVGGVEADTPAEAAGVLIGDILLAVDGQPVLSAERLARLLNRGATAGQARTLALVRGGARVSLALTPVVQAAA